MHRAKSLPEFVQTVLIAAGYATAIYVYRTFYPDNYTFLTPDEVALGFFMSVGAMWSAVKLLEANNPASSWARLMDEFCVGTGVNLIVDAVLNYFQILTRSLFLIVVGSFIAVLLLGLARLLVPHKRDRAPGFLLIGYDRVAHQLGSALGLPLLGVVGEKNFPDSIPWLGDGSRFEEVVAKLQPEQIVLARGGSAACVSSTKLFAQKLRGIPITDVSSLCERLLGRIDCQGFDPADLVLSQPLSTNSRMLAVQAVYTNLIGMALLIALSPLMLLVAISVALCCGPGPLLETDEYCGFQNIPFRLTRFRTTRLDGQPSAFGIWLERLKLNRLPQLFQVVRGEMALFGPRPVRRQFARRMTEMMPFYGMRFSVKPGLMGWAQLKLCGESSRTCELTEFEYDLYYVKRGSPLLDLDILVGTLLGSSRPKVSPETVPAAQ